jgi:hypothetical protein
MRFRGGAGWLIALAVAGQLLLAATASAHVTKVSGPFRVEFGWGSEPALAGSANFVDVKVSNAAGVPVSAGAGALDAQVSFGAARVTLPLLPGEVPGAYSATLVPTRPGTYSFRISGELAGRPVEVAATCSEATFECVDPVTEVEFPVKDPPVSDIAQRLSRELPRAQQSGDTADQARLIAIAAIALAAIALAVALVLGLRTPDKSD